MATTEMRFSELSAAAILSDDDILALSKVDQTSASGYMSYKATMIAIGLYITKLANYTSDLQTTDKTIIGAINELKQLIALIPQFDIEVVEELPTEDISETTIYMVPSENPETENAYDEFIYVDEEWEQVGSTAVDLSAYYTKLEVNGLLDLKESKADMEDDVTEILKDLSDDVTVTGNPVTFETINGGIAKSCEVTMNPVQDLHGQSAPYPAGGGQNKYSVLIGNDNWTGYNGGTSSGTDGVLSITATSTNNSGVYASSTNKLYIFAGSNAGKYTFSADIKASANATLRVGFLGLSQKDFSITTNWQRISTTFTLDGSSHSFVLYSRGDAVTYEIKNAQIESGETATDYAPYSNICPISGRDSVDVVVTGKNLLSNAMVSGITDGIAYTVNNDGTINVNGTATAETSKTARFSLKAGSYIYSSSVIESFQTYDSYLIVNSKTIARGIEGLGAFTLSEDSDVMLAIRVRNGKTVNIVFKPMIRLATETDSSFVPYTKQTKTITFPSTIYGGTVDLVSGKVTVEWLAHTVDENSIISNIKSGENNTRFTFVIPSQVVNALSTDSTKYLRGNILPTVDAALWSEYDSYVGISLLKNYYTTIVVSVPKDTYGTTESSIKTKLAETSLVIAFKLATPTEITLTPQEIALLKGQNVLFTDGDNIKLVASKLANVPDLLTYIQSLEARIKALEEA